MTSGLVCTFPAWSPCPRIWERVEPHQLSGSNCCDDESALSATVVEPPWRHTSGGAFESVSRKVQLREEGRCTTMSVLAPPEVPGCIKGGRELNTGVPLSLLPDCEPCVTSCLSPAMPSLLARIVSFGTVS